MAQKHVVATFSHPPYGSIWYTEGLRAAVGVTAGTDEHTVDVIYLGDGVFFALKGVDRTDSARYIGTLAKGGSRPKVEAESLKDRAISKEDLATDVDVIPRREVLALISRADHTIDF